MPLITLRIEILPSLAETLGMEKTTEEVISAQEIALDYSVGDLLNRLCLANHRFNGLVFDVKTQKLTGQVIIFLNGRNVELVNGLETRLTDGDTLTFIPFIEGG